jgi:beta-lactam-binding protein with PASTA domain
MFPLRPSRATVRRLALALLCVAAPVCAHAQVAGPPAPGTPTPTTTTRTRPPVDVGAITAEAAEQLLVTVPDLSGRTVSEARRMLGSMGLGVGRVSNGPAGTGAPGTIMQQQPRAGSAVAPRSDVRLWLVPAREAAAEPQGSVLSRPPVQAPEQARVRVPLLVGRSVEDARGMLAQVTLEVASVGEVAADGTPGTIVRQSPRAGATVAPKSGVQLWIVPERQVAVQPQEQPAASRLVRVPSVVGRTVVDAQRVIAASGLGAGPLSEAAGTSAPGTVSRQEPAAGASVAANTPVRLWLVPPARVGQVATRPTPAPPAEPRPTQPRPQPTQPPVQRPTPQTPDGQTPAVQTPTPAAPATSTDAVTTPPATEPVTAPADSAAVPDVRRMRLDEARGILAAAGLAAAFDAALADSAGWMVSAQQPGPGARLASGGVVALLLDPPASGSTPVAGTTTPQPPLGSGLQPSEAAPVVQPLWERKTTWIALAVLLLLAAAVATAKRMRAGKLPPVTTVSARLRMDAPARVAVEGAPFGPARLRFRMNPGRTVANVSAAGPLFVRKEVSGD